MKKRSSGMSPLKRWAIALLLSVAAVGAVWIVRQSLSSEDVVIVPDVVGMRLDEARLRLSRLGIHGPDLTLYLEFCNGRCEPTTTPPVGPETDRLPESQ